MCIIQTLLTRFIAFQADHAIYYPYHKSTITSKPNITKLFILLSYRSVRLSVFEIYFGENLLIWSYVLTVKER